ncbi:class I SAM-dependent methyltransferase [Fibrella aquatilis]|uniref:Class I SAM-dependent methyltransferase n=1 Tax=Fibrella aquatilis TaxID=2817059 RepID=A0A939G4Z1_9BACT|nr:class I SAM-dependent methyltransferase [Fibrella aquatilis]MBO0932472.1 class I SAM-dependent methyltransferase [Fibrella aquatilis]
MTETATWIDFWQGENAFDQSMSMNYAYFLDRVEQYITLTPTTSVLDVGSGPGHLADAWHHRVGRLTGLDIAKRYNDIVRARHADHPNVTVHDLPADDFLHFPMLDGHTFDVIIVMSVLQYYPNIEAVETLLTNLKSLAKPGTKILLCDLIVGEAMLKDVVSALGQSLRQGRLAKMLSLLFRLRFSAYYGVRQQNGFLVIPPNEWLALCKRLDLKAYFLPEPITLQHDRMTLLIDF